LILATHQPNAKKSSCFFVPFVVKKAPRRETMFWYIKYPLIIILILALLGLGGIVWRSCLKTVPRPETEEQVVAEELPVAPVQTTAHQPGTVVSRNPAVDHSNREYS